MAKTSKLVGYGIDFEMKLVGGAKTADDFKRAAKSVEQSVNRATNASKQYRLKMEALNQAFRKGAIDQKQYEAAMASLQFREMKRLERLEKQRRAVLGLDDAESLLHRKRMQRARAAGMAASAASGLGFGGRAAGAARFLGGVAGLGLPAAGLGAGFAGISVVKDSISAFAELEKNVVALKVLFGEGLGGRLQVEFRELAKTTILTNSQLIENAKTWASYGLTTEGLTDRLKRLGTVAGGNSEKFRQLTIAFAQVNAQGKLMGQEKNQLINAGFGLQAVAEAAGISMNEFADAMKNGEIQAEHLNEALVKVTSEGGMFGGFLEEQAETLSGKLTVLTSSYEEFLQLLGESESGPAGKFLDRLIDITEGLKETLEEYNKVFEPGKPVGKSKDITEAKSESDFFSFIRGALNKLPFPELYGESDIKSSLNFRKSPESGSIFAAQELETGLRTGTPFAVGMQGITGRIFATLLGEELGSYLGGDPNARTRYRGGRAEFKKNRRLSMSRYADPLMESVSQAREAQRLRSIELAEEDQRSRDQQRSEIEQDIFDQTMKNFNLTIDEFSSAVMQLRPSKEGFENKLYDQLVEEFLTRAFTEGGAGFVGPVLGSRKDQESRLAEIMKEEQRNIDSERDKLESKEKDEKEKHKREMELIAVEEKLISEKLAREKRIAAGPKQKDAFFEGGSVEEFMFLRRQTQISDEAKATKEAEDRAQRQRQEIADRKEQLDTDLKETMSNINAALEELNKRES
jgi:tape measure domain-containing protein